MKHDMLVVIADDSPTDNVVNTIKYLFDNKGIFVVPPTTSIVCEPSYFEWFPTFVIGTYDANFARLENALRGVSRFPIIHGENGAAVDGQICIRVGMKIVCW